MRVSIVPIGNSRGIRIPKPILEHCHMKKEVVLEIEGDEIIIKPVMKKARDDWGLYFRKMRDNKDDKLVVGDNIDLDMGEWEW